MINKRNQMVIVGLAMVLATSGLAAPADDGFVSIFNGKDLSGWDGDSRLWSVKDGVIVGETTAEARAHGNTFLIWDGGKLDNFTLRLKFRIGSRNNSGVQFRSVRVDTGKSKNKWVVKGYQVEVQEAPGKVGFLYDEKRRGWLVNVGDLMVTDREGDKLNKRVVSKIADKAQLIKEGYYKSNKTDQWNQYEITCRGNHILIKLNGYQTVELIDNDKKDRTLAGILALQLHAGAPMRVEFKDIEVRKLTENYGEAKLLLNGKDLTGWTVPLEKNKDTFSVKDAAIDVTGKPSGYIRTEKDYTNYVLRLQIRHLVKCNCGVLVRMTGQDKVWPKSIECQGAKDNMGDIWNIDKFPMKVAEERTRGRRTIKMHETNERPVGEWNQYEIYLNKGDLKIYVNNLLQNVATDCQEVPGKIGLQSEGGAIQYRNIVLIPIGKPAGPGK